MNSIFKDYTEINESRIESIVKRVNSLSLECKRITTDQTRVSVNHNGKIMQVTREEEYFINKTNEFRKRLRSGETIDGIMVEALAIVREAIRRRLGMMPYDTQIEASISMIGGKIDKNNRERVIAEMKTGEGKTLVQILVAYLNALEATKDIDPSKWSSVHVMTSNDALAKRDQTANKKVFSLLGLTSSFVPSRGANKTNDLAQRMINKRKKQDAYKCDIVYATTSTIAFDYLEDNIIYDKKHRNINRSLGFAIVDEADDTLIDQATNPLRLAQTPRIDGSEYDKYLIKRQKEVRDLYKWATDFLYGKIRKKEMTGKIYDQYYINRNEEFKEEYAYIRDTREVILSDRIQREISSDLGHSPRDNEIFYARYYALINCIKAKEGFSNNVDYRVDIKDGYGEVILIDQNIGRKKYSSKYTGGMQEAIEAKEEYLEQDSPSGKKRYHIKYSNGTSIKATCTYPDFLSIYEHNVCGMTGTSDEEEFKTLYGFDTYRVRTRKRNIRIDEEPELYATKALKYNAILEDVKKHAVKGQPILIGTTSVKESEMLSSLLKEHFIRHQVLNANNEAEENEIIAGAGMVGTITIATNMAGRGTDIKLGPGARELGGLYVIGTSRNKSSRIDRQLMGRSARQGDPGKTKYYSSLEDDLVREYYRGDILDTVIEHYSKKPNPIKNKKIIESARRAQEIRERKDKKIRLDNEKFNITFINHRKAIYENRNKVLDSNPLEFINMIKSIIVKYSSFLVKNNTKEEIKTLIGHLINVDSLYTKDSKETEENISNALFMKVRSNFSSKGIKGEEVAAYVENMRKKFLNIIDMYWLNHIEYLDDLKSSASLNATEDPFKDYANTSTKVFANILVPSIYNEMITYASNPGLNYGEYEIKAFGSGEGEKHTL